MTADPCKVKISLGKWAGCIDVGTVRLWSLIADNEKKLD